MGRPIRKINEEYKNHFNYHTLILREQTVSFSIRKNLITRRGKPITPAKTIRAKLFFNLWNIIPICKDLNKKLYICDLGVVEVNYSLGLLFAVWLVIGNDNQKLLSYPENTLSKTLLYNQIQYLYYPGCKYY